MSTMSAEEPTPAPITPVKTPPPWSRFARVVMPFFQSDLRFRAVAWLMTLLVLTVSVIGLNLLNTDVGARFFTAVSERNEVNYRAAAVQYVLVFGLMMAVGVGLRFSEERLGLLWRGWLTGHLLDKYLAGRAYLRMLTRAEIDNPDQRMTEDVKNFTTMTLSFLMLSLNASITAVAFSIKLYRISPQLLAVAIGYAVLGTGMTMLVGRKLIRLNNAQLQKEANFRYELIHVREYAESIALLKGEPAQRKRLGGRLKELVDNFRTIVGVNRNLGMFTIYYNYLIQVIPLIIAAPLYIQGKTELGVITQAASVFATLLAAFSLIVTQFQQISTYVAVVNRVGMIWDVLSEPPQVVGATIEVVHDDTRVAYENLTLRSPKDGSPLIAGLNLEVPQGRRLMIFGPDGVGKSALVRASAGIWPTGEGRIVRPHAENIMFIPQRPYTALGTLRDQFFEVDHLGHGADERLTTVLTQVAFGPVLDRVGGLDVERDWGNILTVGEQQMLGIARLLIANPRFAFLDRATNALSSARARHIYEVLSYSDISYVSVTDQANLRDYHDDVLDLLDAGSWTVTAARGGPAAA